MTVIPIVVGALGMVLKGFERKLEELGIRGRIKAIQIAEIVEISQNTQRSPRDLRRLAQLL